MNCLVLIFSKDRALQLDATLRSFLLHCVDAKSFQIRILYTTSAPIHAEQYETLIGEYRQYDFIRFLQEQDFRSDVLALIAPFDYILFMVDDNIFVRDFRLAEIIRTLQKNEDAIGASLRLGRNTAYCYTLDKNQRLPEFQAMEGSILKYAWTAAEYDFGYPLELSSSVYRTEDLLPYLAGLQFKNPNTLEGMMNFHKKLFNKDNPFLLCFAESVAFSIPLNMVQTMWQNRTSMKSEYSPEKLAARFAEGHRIDVRSYDDFTPGACHQEVELKFKATVEAKVKAKGKAEEKTKTKVKVEVAGKDKVEIETERTQQEDESLISVIIPCYNQAQFLREAVESIVKQTYRDWECIIVNDGSPDNTSDVARDLIAKYPQCSIRFLEKPNTGLADARNTGIREAKGTWILPLDSDDMFAPDFMERAVKIINDNPSINLVTTNEQAFGVMPHVWIPNEYTPKRILTENTFIYASLYKKELWEKAGGYYPGIPWGAEDWNFWIACSKAGIVHKRIPEKLFLYRTHPGTSMRNKMKEHWSEVVAMVHTLHPGLYPAQRLVEDHKIISSVHRDTVARIDSIISRFPDLSMPYFWRGLVHERVGNPDLAQTNYERSLALSGKDNWQQDLRLKQIKALYAVSKFKDSLTAPEHLLPASVIKDILDNPRVTEQIKSLFEQADECFLKGDMVQSRENIRKALQGLPNAPALMVAHGNILLRQGLVEEARKEFLRAKILDPQSSYASFSPDALMTLAECYAGTGDHKNAVSLYERAIEISETHTADDMKSGLRIGVPVIGSKLWMGGITYIELLLKALNILPKQERPKIYLVVPENKLNELDLHMHLFPLVDVFVFVGQNKLKADEIVPKPFIHYSSYQDLFSEIDFYFPVTSDAWPDLCSASWISDFQHIHLPEFFQPYELQWRDRTFQKIALFAKLLVLSSKDAEKDFRTLYPHSKSVIRILSFHTIMSDDVYAADPIEVQHKYNLPDEFLICSNQFWAHKNHFLLFEALAELKHAGKPVHLVCTGSTLDYRFPDYFGRVQQKLTDLGLGNLVHILGIIPRNEQLQLMRRATAVVQPSLFEGWSTVVEDARALGKDMILSDLPVHMEQAPQNAVYFQRNSRDDLAQKISGCLPGLKPGPDLSREEAARRKGKELVKAYALQFCNIALEAQHLYKKIFYEEIVGSLDENNSVPPSQAPPPVTAKDTVANVWSHEENPGITIIAPDNYANKSWYEEAGRIFGDSADIAILVPPSGEGFEKIRFRKNILFLGASHHLPGLFDNEERARFWINIPSKKYFYQYEKVIGSFLPDSEERERNIHKIPGIYAVQDEYDLLEYEKVFRKKAIWLPDMISAERIRRGQAYPPLSQRPIDLLFVGKIQAPWYKERQEILRRLDSFGAAQKLKTVIIDTSYIRFNDIDIIEKNYYSQAKIVINPIGTGNFFNIRFFEALAAGCICLQQADNNGVLLNVFLERYKEYNAVYFTCADLEQKISSIFSDISSFEKNVSKTRSLLAERDTGEARFQSLGIPFKLPGSQLAPEDSPKGKPAIKVSAIVSTYNAERFIRGCLEDLVNQTLYKKGEVEIIVVDSASQQNEENIVKEFQSKYPNIRYIRTEQRETVYAAWNRGIKEAQGIYITNANTDDRHREDAFEKMAGLMDENPEIGLVYGDVIVTETENQTFEEHIPSGTIRQQDFNRESLALVCFIGPQPMWRRTLHDQFGFFDETFVVSGDWEFWLRIAENTKCLHIPESLGLYFRSSSGVENSNRDQKKREDRLIIRKYLPRYWPTLERDLMTSLDISSLDADSALKFGEIFTALEKPETAMRLFSAYLEHNHDDFRIRNALENLEAEGPAEVQTTETVSGRQSPAGSEISPLVSVIIPCYKHAQYLHDAVESVANQTYKNWECIIVNDGSPDNTSKVSKDLIAQYPGKRIVLIEKENGGLADARNFGIKNSKGKYILPLDADDKIHPEMLQKTAALLDANPGIAIVYTYAVHFDDKTNAHRIIPFREYDDRELAMYNCFSYCSLYRREAWEKTGGYNTKMTWGYEDWDFWVGCVEKGFRIKKLSEPLFFYRTKESSMITKAVEHDAELKARIILNHPGIYDMAQISWAKGISAHDPDVLDIPHREGIIPGFFDALPSGLSSPEGLPLNSSSTAFQQVEKDNPLVSVIIPCYNQAQYLPEAVESVVNQTFQDWECIIVNDGSPDKTSIVAKALIAKYSGKKIILFKKENGGLADARNFGIRHALGEYILPLDSDDLIHPSMLQKTVDLLNSNADVSIAYTDAVYSGKDNKIVRSGEFDLEKLCIRNRFNYCSLYRRAVWEAAGGYKTNMVWGYEDWDFWISCAEKGFHGRRIPEPLFIYRVKESSMYTKAREHDDELKALIVTNHPGLYDEKTRQWAEDFLENTKALSKKELFLEPSQIAAVYCVYDDVTWLNDSLESVYFDVDAIYFLVSNQPWYGQATGNNETIRSIRNFHDALNKIKIIEGSWSSETEQRNAGLDILKQAGFAYCLVIDADEIYDPAELNRMKDLVISRPDVDCWHISLDTYWKSYRYRIEPREPLKPPVFVKTDSARFTQNRLARGSSHMVVPPETCICHHLSYARSDNEVMKKISSFSHANEVMPGWFENIWKKWDTDHGMTNLHPTHPHAYQKAVEQAYSALPPVLKRHYLKDEKNAGTVIPGLTSIIILAHNQWIQTEICLLSIERHTHEPHEIIVVDNGSTDETQERLGSFVKEKQNLKVIRNDTNLGFAAGNNQGIAIAQGEYILLLNNDTIVTSGWLGRMLNIFRQYPETGVIGPMSNYVSGPQLIEKIEHSTIEEIDSFAELWRKEHDGQSFPIYRVVGFCLLTRRELVDRIGGLDEQFGSGNFEDDDFCLRAALIGYHARVAQDVFIHHSGSQTFKSAGIDYRESLFRNWELFKAKWGIPLETPYGAEYQFPPQNIPGISLYAPLPLLSLDHEPDIMSRWWEETQGKEKAKVKGQVQKTQKENEMKQRIKGFTSIIVLLSGRREYSRKCVESIRKHTKEPHEIVFIPYDISYAPPKWLRQLLKEKGDYKFLNNTTSGFSSTCNIGIAETSGEYVVIIDDAAVVTEDWLAGMLDCLNSAEDTGIVGPMTVNIEGQQSIKEQGSRDQGVKDSSEKENISVHSDPGILEPLIPEIFNEFAKKFMEKNRYRRVNIKRLDSFCTLFRHSLTEKTGLFDESLHTNDYAVHDYCLRAVLEGSRNLIAGDVFIHFHGHKEEKLALPGISSPIIKDKRIFIEKWGDGPGSLLKSGKGAVANTLFLADDLLQKGQKDKAAASLAEGIRSYPGEKRLHHMLAGILIEEGKFREALDIIERMPEELKNDIKTLELSGFCKEGLGLLSEAEQVADRVLSMKSSSPGASILKGTLSFRRLMYPDAEKYFQKAMESDRGFGEAYANLGALKWQHGKKEEALSFFEKAFILSPLSEDIVTNYYSASVALKKLPEAERTFRETISLHPFNRRLKFILVDNLLQQGKFHEAMHEMEEGLITFGIDDNTIEVALRLRSMVQQDSRIQGIKDSSENLKDKGSVTGTLSLCMIVKNEEENIAKALHSIKTAVDEMIVVDTGSTDRTKKIAKVFGAKVYDFEWNNDFSAARNFSLSKASGQWILVLDADEVIAASDHNKLRELITPLPPTLYKGGMGGVFAYSFVTRNYVGPVSVNWHPNDGKYKEEAGSGWFPSAKVRLFPNNSLIRFDKPVHETVEASLLSSGFEIRKSEIPIHHYGKLNMEVIKEKGEEYYQLGKKKLAEKGEQNPQALYELAIQASELERFDEALEYWERLIAVKPDFPNAYHGQGTAYYKLGRYKEAHGAFHMAGLIDPGAKDPGVMCGLCELLMGNTGSSIKHLEGLLERHPGYPLALLAITTAYFCAGRKEMGLKYLDKVKNTQFTIAPYFTDIAKLLKSAVRFDSAVRLLEAAVETGNTNEETQQLLEELKNKQGSRGQGAEGSRGEQKQKDLDPIILEPLNPAPATLSLCMIVKNEEENIERALMSVKSLVDEMIVVDTGSFDRTREIAKRLGAKVSVFPWTGNFSDARNFSISQASGRWVLILDADEVISPLDHERLKELITEKGSRVQGFMDSRPGPHSGGFAEENESPEATSENLNSATRPLDPTKPALIAYSFVTRNYVLETNTAGWIANDGRYFLEEAGSGWYPGEKVRLFPKDSRIRFEFPVHERIEPSLMKAGIDIMKSGIPVHHYGKLDREKARSKAEAYYRLAKEKLAESGGGDAMALYELAIQGAETGRYEETLDHLKKVIALKPDFTKAYHSMGNACFNLGRYEDALSFYRKASEMNPDSRDSVLMFATTLAYTGSAEASIPLLEVLLKNDPDYPQAILLLSGSYFLAINREKGSESIKKLKERNLGFEGYFMKLAKIFISLQMHGYATSLLEAVMESGKSPAEAEMLLKECYNTLKDQQKGQ